MTGGWDLVRVFATDMVTNIRHEQKTRQRGRRSGDDLEQASETSEYHDTVVRCKLVTR